MPTIGNLTTEDLESLLAHHVKGPFFLSRALLPTRRLSDTLLQAFGQGALWIHGKQALALFLVKKDATHELWGASLRCQ